MVSAIRLQFGERLGGVDQGELKMIVLERDDHRARVQPQDPGEIGALDAPRLTREDRLLLELGEQVPARSTSTLETSSSLRLAICSTRSWPALDAVEGAGIHAPVLVDAKVGIGGHQQCVVLGGLNVPLPGIEDPLRDQRLEEGVGQVHELK